MAKADEELEEQQQTPPGRRLKDVLDLAHSLLAEHGLQNWRISFDHARRRAGLCNFSTKTISLSRHYAREATLDHIKDTILHEIAHALVGLNHGHDAVWRRKAQDIGCSAMRCHNLKFTKSRWVMICPNGCFVVERHRRKSGLICSSCKHSVEFVPAQDYE